MTARFYFPRWLFPKNLGDSIASTFIPKLLSTHTRSGVEVITEKGLHEIFARDPVVVSVREPLPAEILDDGTWRELSLGKTPHPEFFSVYPEWHRDLFPFWKEHFNFLTNHPTANIITVNYLLQMGLTEYLFHGFDLRPVVYTDERSARSSQRRVGIVPATKLAGRETPHPHCDGKGLRYKEDAWRRFVGYLSVLRPDIEIVEISDDDLKMSPHSIRRQPTFMALAHALQDLDLVVLSDGGIHNFCNALNIPVVLFSGTLVNKPEFFKLGNAHYPESLHLPCRTKCWSYYLETFGGEDLSKSCQRQCENLDPKLLAEYTASVLSSLYPEVQP